MVYNKGNGEIFVTFHKIDSAVLSNITKIKK